MTLIPRIIARVNPHRHHHTRSSYNTRLAKSIVDHISLWPPWSFTPPQMAAESEWTSSPPIKLSTPRAQCIHRLVAPNFSVFFCPVWALGGHGIKLVHPSFAWELHTRLSQPCTGKEGGCSCPEKFTVMLVFNPIYVPGHPLHQWMTFSGTKCSTVFHRILPPR